MTEPTSEAQLVTVADGVHAWIGAGGNSNAGAIETPEGVIVIDTQQTVPRPPIARRGARQDRKAARALVNTHCHLDHTPGNTVFADVPILAHEKTLAAMNACLGPRTRRMVDPRLCHQTPLPVWAEHPGAVPHA